MNSNLPVLFLAFANEQHEGRYLSKIVEEYKQLYRILSPVAANESAKSSEEMLCELVIRQNVTIGEIIDVFQNPRYKDRIAIFHYGGHADGYQLLLEGEDGQSAEARGEGLVPLLGRRKSLKLVFLNGCSTQQLARDLVERGVPAVIGTSVSISDETALLLSKRFYQGLANGFTLAGAWEEAKDEIKMTGAPNTPSRSIRLREAGSGRFPWDVEFRDDAGKEVFDNWNLPGAAANPLFGLPPLPPTQLPASPFRFLKPYTAEHAEIFFGRSYYIRDLWLKIVEPNAPSVILLYGESGAGKSSLLDAGLRPRLEAAVKADDPESRRFEVRYRRRDQDRGLVGDLADLLDYRPEAEHRAARPAPAEEADPDQEKIQAIESIAQDLEQEETRNTLRVFLDRYHAGRAAKPERRRSGDIYQYGKLRETAGAELRKAWLKIERESGRQLIVVLDQVEELFTRPHARIKRELEDLLQVLKEIFGKSADPGAARVQGRIILGYREEFNARILARFKDYELARSTVFLEHLNEADIREVFQGLQQGKAGAYYGITVEDHLPARIAGHLLRSRSAVAPVLQLLLTKLWKKTYDEQTDSAAFTVEAYNEIQSRREEMEEYFHSQMRRVSAWNPEVVETGLVLDILNYHVSDLGTSRRRHIEEIDRRYRHLEDEFGYSKGFIGQLVARLKDPEIFLLNDEGHGHTGLPHDTLAPIIAREYHRSDKLGQRSARILDIKGPDLERAAREKEALKKLRLDDNDLEVVEGGKKGMRNLRDTERRLLAISLEEREKRLRLRRMLVRGGIVAGLFILFLFILSGMLSFSVTEQLNRAIVNSAHEQSLAELNQPGEVDYFSALQLAQFAYKNSPVKRLDVVQNLHGILQDSSALQAIYGAMYLDEEEIAAPAAAQRPLTQALKPDAKINSLAYEPSLGLLAGVDDGRLIYRPGGQAAERSIDISAYTQDFRQAVESDPSLAEVLWTGVDFSADGRYLQLLAGVNAEKLYLLDGRPVSPPVIPLAVPSSGAYFGYYDLFTGVLVDREGNRYAPWEFYDVYGYPYEVAAGEEVVELEAIFYYQLWDEQRNLLRKADWVALQAEGWPLIHPLSLEEAVLYDPDRAVSLAATNLTRRTYNSCLVWDPESSSDEPVAGFYEEGVTAFFSALSADRVLIVRPGGEAVIRNAAGASLHAFTMPAGAPHIGVSPDRRRIYAISRDSVVLWDLYGERDTAYRQEGIRRHAFSPDGAYLLTQSAAGVRVWSTRGELRDFPNQVGDSVVLARFQGYGHLVIGCVTSDASKAWWQNVFGRQQKKKRKIRIDYWNLQSGFIEQSFEAPGAGLLDAAVSEEGDFAVAIQPVRSEAARIPVGNVGLGAMRAGGGSTRRPEVRSKATVIPSDAAKRQLKARDYQAAGILPLAQKREDAEFRSNVFLSPRGKYIVRQSGAKKIELFNLRGRPVNAFEVGNGFLPGGYDRELFTPDDYYLLTHKSDEAFFWHPEEDQIEWPVYDLDVVDKQAYGLITFTDYIPGRTTENKFLALGVLVLALIFSLLYFSDAIIRLVQQRQYLELGLYGAVFLLFSLLLAWLWNTGMTEAGGIETAFYSLVLANLGLAVLGGRRYMLVDKPGMAALFAVAGLLLLAGGGAFFLREQEEVKKANQEIYLQDLRKDYRLNQFHSKAYYDSLYLATTGSMERPAGGPGLTGAQLRTIAGQHRVYLESAYQEDEGFWLLIGGMFTVLVGVFFLFPLYLSIRRFRAGKVAAFYRWLLLPLGLLLLSGWGALALAEDSVLVLDALNAGAALVLVTSVVRRGLSAYRQRQWSHFLVYGTLMTLSVLFLAGEGGLFAPAIAAAFIEARQGYRRQPHGAAFAWMAAGLFLVFGALALAVFWGSVVLAGLLGVAPLLVLILYGLRRQKHRLGARKAAGKTPWPNRLAMTALWLAGGFVAFLYLGFLIQETYYDDDYYEYEQTAYPEEADPGTDTYEDFEPAPAAESINDADALEADSLPGEIPVLRTEPVSANEGPAGNPAVTGEAVTPEEPVNAAPAPAPRQPVDFSSPSLNNRQRLIVELFDPDTAVRDQARQTLVDFWTGDRALIGELIQYNYENPDKNEGIWNTLYLLEAQPDYLLRSNRALLISYLEWVSAKGYGPETIDRVNGLRNRVQ